MPAGALARQVASPPALNDPSFDAALPPLDSAAPQPAAPPLPVAPPAPAPDPELIQPLEPIGSADTTPPAPTAEQAGTGDVTLRIRYETTVTGLAGFKTDAIEGDLGRQFRALSALIKDGNKAANAAQVKARADEDVQLAQRIMKAAGYYDGIASSTIDLVPGQPGVVRVTLSATPGPRYVLNTITVTGAPPEPTKIARDSLGLKAGQPVDAALIEGSEANVSLQLPQFGYPFAKLGDRDIALDDTLHNADYVLPIDAGAKSRFRNIQTTGDPVFTVSHLNVFPRYKPGDVYDSRLVEDIRQALVATSLFSTVSVEPVKTGVINPDGTEAVDLLVRQTKGPWHSLAATAGYSTGQGATATGSYTWRNLFSPEGALILTAVAGTQEQGGSVTFRRSDAGQRDRTFQTVLAIDNNRYAAYKADTADLSVSLSRTSTPIWQKRWTWSLGAEIVGTNEAGAALTLGGAQPRITYLVGAIPLLLGYDRSDSLLNPTKGFRITAKLSPETSLKGGKVSPYARTLLLATGYYPISPSLVLAARGQVGSIFGTSVDDLAPSRRLYSGGGGSVRGYGYQQLGPKDANNNPIGGRDQTEFAIEARYRFGNYGIVPFIDGGRVGESSTPGLSGMRYGAGIGGRFYTNFGPLRVDVATPIARKPGESVIALYIGIGQAF
ncbi:autotransporter assembly complex protein TamA [Novosphingobium sp.]|uniref:autotransporter assembly complex protein TamA n=1 Tax=Novosphingobium sp. TaxID=1874826 RepID=UPI003D0FB47B